MVMRLAVVLALLAALMPAASALAQDDPPRREGRVTGGPPPPVIVQGPNEPDVLPCGVDGLLNDGQPYINTSRPAKAAMLFVDFEDQPADVPDLQAKYDEMVLGMRAGLRDLSRGRFDIEVTPVLRWLRMPKALKSYGFDDEADDDALGRYVRDALKAAGGDFSGYQALYLVAPKEAELRAFAYVDNAKRPYGVDGLQAVSLLIASDDAQVLLHETGHLLGLDDLYSYSNDSNAYMGPWDVMSETWNQGTPLLSWMRYLVGWVPRKAFRCVSRTTTATLQPAESDTGPRTLLVRVGESLAYVLEAEPRSPEIGCPAAGVLIYRVDTSKYSGEGPLRAIDSRPRGMCEDVSDGPFRVGMRYRAPGGRFTVRVLGQTANAFRVKVTVPRTSCAVPRVVGTSLAVARRRLISAGCRLGNVRESGARVAEQSREPGTVLGPRRRVAVVLG